MQHEFSLFNPYTDQYPDMHIKCDLLIYQVLLWQHVVLCNVWGVDLISVLIKKCSLKDHKINVVVDL